MSEIKGKKLDFVVPEIVKKTQRPALVPTVTGFLHLYVNLGLLHCRSFHSHWQLPIARKSFNFELILKAESQTSQARRPCLLLVLMRVELIIYKNDYLQ